MRLRTTERHYLNCVFSVNKYYYRYAALKQLKGITSVAPDTLPTSSTLSSAIIYEKPGTVAQLLEEGVDLNDTVQVCD